MQKCLDYRSRSIADLVAILAAWKSTLPPNTSNTIRIDGSVHGRGKRSNFPFLAFNFDGLDFHLDADTTLDGVNEFLRLSQLKGSANALVFAKTRSGNAALRLTSSPQKARGWYCYQRL